MFKKLAGRTGGGKPPPIPEALSGSDMESESEGEKNFEGNPTPPLQRKALM